MAVVVSWMIPTASEKGSTIAVTYTIVSGEARALCKDDSMSFQPRIVQRDTTAIAGTCKLLGYVLVIDSGLPLIG